jgi:LuxR family transcriptional regulator, maltose regulon positive regulatory protein
VTPGPPRALQLTRDANPPDLRSVVHGLAPVEAKIHVPAVRPGIVARTALVDRARRGEPVVVISAPAGYGKTTLLSQWAAADERPFAWLTVTEGDNDLTVLVAYLIRALDAVDPLPPETLAAFAAPGADGPTVLLPRLGRTLFERSRPFVLALDDVHLLSDPDSLHALSVLVSHLPEGSQLALATRQDLPLARARLRARRTLMELRAEDLTLSGAEGVAALRDAGFALDAAAAESLVEQTEGWPAGIYLAALAVRDGGDPEQAATRFTGDHRLVAEYFRDELLDALPSDLLEFLTRTSVLEYLDGAACDALLERSASWDVLDGLARSNLFVVPLDATGEQYRYHHLFADLLHQELRRREPELEPELHARASAIFAARDQPSLAIQHARLAGDVEGAVQLVWLNSPVYLGSGRYGTIERWLALFTREEIAEHPALAVASAWCRISTNEWRPIDDLIELASRGDLSLPLPDGLPVGAAVALLEAVACEHGVERMRNAARTASELDTVNSFFTPTALYLEGAALLLLGQSEAARARLQQAVRSTVITPGSASSALAQLALIAISEGSWEEAELIIGRAVDLVDEHRLGQLVPQAVVFAVSAYVKAHAGDTVGARYAAVHARRLLAFLNHFAVWLAIEARIVLARMELLCGELDAARVLAEEAKDLVVRMPDAGVLPERIADVYSAISSGNHAASAMSAAPLTTAELRVLAYLPTHLSFQAMAEDLFVSRNTVKTQAISIYRKLGVSSRGDAVLQAREFGLIE